MNPKIQAIIVTAITDFAIASGGAYLAGITAAPQSVPSWAVIITACVTGAVQAARGVQKLLALPPTN
jgi:hypothetical protein